MMLMVMLMVSMQQRRVPRDRAVLAGHIGAECSGNLGVGACMLGGDGGRLSDGHSGSSGRERTHQVGDDGVLRGDSRLESGCRAGRLACRAAMQGESQ
jgi:hypothetical protein